MSIELLKEQIKVVHAARSLAVGATLAIAHLREEWQDANAGRIEAAQALYAAKDEAEEKLRVLTLEAYAASGNSNKTPAPGVGIREVTTLEYDPLKAFGWAVAHELALTLDKKAFEKMALASPSSMVDMVKITKEPQATIAADLSEAVKQLLEAKNGD